MSGWMRRRRNQRVGKAAERVTAGLAAVAVVTAGTVIAGEIGRLRRRRRESKVPDAETVGEAASQVTQDAVAVARSAYIKAPRHELIMFNILAGFLGAFTTVRLSTWGIRSGWWPTSDMVLGDTHVHHFVPGILIAFIAGGAALVTENRKQEEGLAAAFGAGVGLTFDEAALLLDLRDVYWSREGLLSVQVSLGATAMLSAAILAMRMLRRGEQHAEAVELIPHSPATAELHAV